MSGFLKLFDRPVAFDRIYVEVTGSIVAGLFLTQAMEWQRRAGSKEAWWRKTQAQWTDETCLSRREQDTARKRLRALGILQDERRGMPAKVWYRIDAERLSALIEVAIEKPKPKRKPAQTTDEKTKPVVCDQCAAKGLAKGLN